jgi:hypothetical protein
MHAITGYMGTTLTMVNGRETGGVRLSLIRLAMLSSETRSWVFEKFSSHQGIGRVKGFHNNCRHLPLRSRKHPFI